MMGVRILPLFRSLFVTRVLASSKIQLHSSLKNSYKATEQKTGAYWLGIDQLLTNHHSPWQDLSEKQC